MKVYIAGKITGCKGYKAKFSAAAKKLTDKGHSVLNPAALPEGMRPGDYMQLCTQMLFAADAVAFLPDWEHSRGARIEYELSLYIGKLIMLLEE